MAWHKPPRTRCQFFRMATVCGGASPACGHCWRIRDIMSTPHFRLRTYSPRCHHAATPLDGRFHSFAVLTTDVRCTSPPTAHPFATPHRDYGRSLNSRDSAVRVGTLFGFGQTCTPSPLDATPFCASFLVLAAVGHACETHRSVLPPQFSAHTSLLASPVPKAYIKQLKRCGRTSNLLQHACIHVRAQNTYGLGLRDY